MRKAVDQGGGYDFRVNILIFSLEMGGDCWSYKIFKITFFYHWRLEKSDSWRRSKLLNGWTSPYVFWGFHNCSVNRNQNNRTKFGYLELLETKL